MRFLIGLLLGFGIGFAAAILFAPERPKVERLWPRSTEEGGEKPEDGNHHAAGGVQQVLQSFRDHLKEAASEAKQASEEKQTEMRARYQKMAKREAEGK